MSNNFSDNLLLNYSQKPIITVKKAITPKSYPELEIFKHQIDLEKKSPHLPYTRIKRKVLTYKWVFLTLCLLFFFLTLTIAFKAVYWPFAHFSYTQFFILKNLVCALCVSIGLSSFSVAYLMKTEKEAALSTLRHARYRLNKAYARKKIEAGIKGMFAFGHQYQKSQVIKHSYHEAKDKMNHLYDDLLHLFERIHRTTNLTPQQQEHLYNQALLEFSDKIRTVINLFK